MRLWTVQPLWLFESLMNQGEFYFHSDMRKEYDKENKQYWQWLDAYEWLKVQMDKKGIVRPEKADDLGWAWYLWTDYQHYPAGYWIKKDLNPALYDHLPVSERVNVRIELEMDESKILLSDYDAWHHVMNYSFLDFNEATEEFEARAKKEFGRFGIRHPVNRDNWDNEIQMSWEKIFDLALSHKILNELDDSPKFNPVQATFWSMNATEVVKAELFDFKAKKKVLYKSSVHPEYKKENLIKMKK